VSRLAVVGPAAWRRMRAGDLRDAETGPSLATAGRQLAASAAKITKQTAAWLLGR